jgi:phi13 family phage major tail protein
MADVFEFRGVDNLYYARIIQDDAAGYIADTPKRLSPVAEVAKSTDSSSEAHYYDNKPMIVVASESADTITITMAPPELDILADITGKAWDAATGMLIDGPRENAYFAIMYRTKGTDGKYRYVSRLRGSFSIPEEDNQTENDGTDTTNTQITFTGIMTEHEFTKGRYENGQWQAASAKGIVVDERFGLVDFDDFFSAIQTPDSIQASGAKRVTGVTLDQSTLSMTAGGASTTLVATIAPVDATNQNINWSTSDANVAIVDGVGKVTPLAEGSATITVTTVDGGKTATCAVTVAAGA